MGQSHTLPRLVLNALRAAAELAAARMQLRSLKPHQLIERNRWVSMKVAQRSRQIAQADITQYCDDAAFYIDRMAPRVPWRSDCLVQALACQHWLAQAGIATDIVIGIAKRADGSFESHAWLRQGARVVLGGNVDSYTPLLDPNDINRWPKI